MTFRLDVIRKGDVKHNVLTCIGDTVGKFAMGSQRARTNSTKREPTACIDVQALTLLHFRLCSMCIKWTVVCFRGVSKVCTSLTCVYQVGFVRCIAVRSLYARANKTE